MVNIVNGTPGADTLVGTPGDDWINGYGGNDLLKGRGGDDTLNAGDGRDRALGGGGDDTFILVLTDADVTKRESYLGGKGRDTLDVTDMTSLTPGADRLIFDIPQGGFGLAGAAHLSRIGSIENLTIDTALDVTAIGGAGANDLHTGTGNDVLRGGGGDDALSSAGGNNRLLGGAGNDELYDGTGNDRLRGGQGDDLLVSVDGNDDLFGGAGNDILATNSHDADRLYGQGGDDILLQHDRSAGLFDGGAGVDELACSISAAETGGIMYEINLDTGRVGLFGTADSYEAFATGIENATLAGDAPGFLVGTGGANVLRGNAGGDAISGGGGADRLHGGAGGDEIAGGDGADRLYGEDGGDLIDGGRGADRLIGGTGSDILRGGDGDDRLKGGVGADVLDGGAGRDRLFGGVDTATDVFRFSDPDETSRKLGKADVIGDFVSGTDKIDLSNIDADTGAAGDQAFAASSGPAANHVWLITRTEGLYLAGDVDGDAKRDFAIFLDAALGFSPGDVIL